MHNKNQNFFLQKFLNRYNIYVMEAWREIVFFKKRAFYRLNQRLMPKRVTKFDKRGSSDIHTLSYSAEWLNSGTVERQNVLKRGVPE